MQAAVGGDDGPLSYAVPFGHIPYCPSLPDAMGPLMQFPIEWWYYVGWAHDQTNTKRFTILVNMVRSLDVGVEVMYGIGCPDNNFYSSTGLGVLSTGNSKPTATSWSIEGEAMILGDINSGPATMSCALTSTKKPLGLRGATYKVEFKSTDVSLTLLLKDQLGMVMEIAAKPETQSYEFSMPRLSIMEGSSLTIPASGEVALGGGNIWLDRQTLGPQGLKSPSRLSRFALTQNPSPKPELYTGTWMAIVMKDGTAYMLVFFWKQKDKQWIVGSAVSSPPSRTIGLKYPPLADWNGTAPVQGVHVLDEKDFDLNILNPEDPSNSPHWTSHATSQTYCSAWVLSLEQKRYYINVLVQGSEINTTPKKPGTAYFEGAATIREKSGCIMKEVGHCFVEQMGFTRPPETM